QTVTTSRTPRETGAGLTPTSGARLGLSAGSVGRVPWLPVVAGTALGRLDLQDEAVDLHDPDRRTGPDGGRAVGAGPPAGAPQDHDAVGVDVDRGLADLPDQRLAP